MTSKIPFHVRPMLATLVDEPFDESGWAYEEKYDGIRIIAYKEGSKVKLVTRNDIDRTARYPNVAAAIRSLPAASLILDGEVIVFDRRKVSRFQLLQRGSALVMYAAFDCLFANGKDLRREPLLTRRVELENAVIPIAPLMLSRRLGRNGVDAFKTAKRRGLEGLVAKRLSSRYIEKRSREWLKVKVNQSEEFVIVGYTKPEGARKFFGALLLARYRDGELEYAGRVGTGFNGNALRSLHNIFRPLIRKHPAFPHPPRTKGLTFLSPKLVAQISFTEWTTDRKLRHPVFLGLRDDKAEKEVSV
jgi:bifunctional non-homologous end joining protein LigD